MRESQRFASLARPVQADALLALLFPYPELPATAPPPAYSRQSAIGSSACGRDCRQEICLSDVLDGARGWSGPEENVSKANAGRVLCDAPDRR